MRRCVSEPISWLRLERFALGELPVGERGVVATHLAACERCAHGLERIREDRHRALPPLPANAGHERAGRTRWQWVAWGSVAAAAVAVAIALIVARPGPRVESARPGPRVAIKGGELAVSLVRERAGSVASDPASFAPGDRFKLRVTCPPDAHLFADAVVFQGGEAFFPLAAGEIPCGNLVALPGAFRIDGGEPAWVCVVIAAGRPPDRGQLEAAAGEDLKDAACLRLAPESQ